MERKFNEIKILLEKKGADYRIHIHQPVHTSEQAAEASSEPQKKGIKSLIFYCDGNPFLVLVRADHKADTKKLKRVTGAKDARLATKNEVMSVCNCEIGAIHPLSPLMNISRTIMDQTILENERVNFSGGLNTCTINVKLKDIVGIVEPELADIARD